LEQRRLQMRFHREAKGSVGVGFRARARAGCG
jgi:hypothetical protein